MVTRLSHFFLRTLREDPADAEVTSHRLLVRAGYIRRQAPGIFAWLPLGLKVKAKIEGIIRDEMTNAGAYEVHFPALVPRDPYEQSGRWETYGNGIFRLQGPQGCRLPPRSDARGAVHAAREGPVLVVQGPAAGDLPDPGQVPRRGASPRRPPARPRVHDEGRVLVRLHGCRAGCLVQAQRDAYERIFQRLGLEYVIVAADNGLMGGARSEEFLHPTAIGEDTFVRSAGGYAANVEAFTTVAPEPIPFDGLAEPVIFDSPNTPTIATLVDHANAHLDGSRGAGSGPRPTP